MEYNLHPISNDAQRWPFQFSFSKDHHPRLEQGIIPKSEKNCWMTSFVDNVLCFYHLPEGYCIYKLIIKEEGDKLVAADIWIENNPEIYEPDLEDIVEIEKIMFLLYWGVLGDKHMRESFLKQVDPDDLAYYEDLFGDILYA